MKATLKQILVYGVKSCQHLILQRVKYIFVLSVESRDAKRLQSNNKKGIKTDFILVEMRLTCGQEDDNECDDDRTVR